MYSDELGSFYYEFPVQFTSSLNPDALNKLQKHGGYYTKYNVLAIVNDADGFDFYAVKFYQYIDGINDGLINSDVTFSALESFTGIIQLTDHDKKLSFSKKLKNGEVIDRTTFDKKESSDPSVSNRSQENCDIITIPEYTDWYKVYTIDGVEYIEYTHRQYTGWSIVVVCESGSGGLPELNENGPNSAGVYKKRNSGGPSADDAIILIENEIEDEIINELTGRARCVYEKLEKSKSNLFQKTIGKFIDDPKYNLIFKNGKCNVGGAAGCTNSQEISLTGNVVITIDQLSGSVLENAAMILHEGIHAEIARYVQRHTTGEDPNNRARMFQLYKFYKESEVPSHHLDHPYMTLNYINPIASALRQLDGNKYALDYYKSFAWDGLRNWDVSSLLGIEQSTEFDAYRAIVNSNTTLSCD